MNLQDLADQLKPTNRIILETLAAQLAALEGINVRMDTAFLPTLEDGIPLWASALTSEGRSQRTIKVYTATVRHILADNIEPTSLGLQGYFATRHGKVSASHIATEQKAMRSFFTFLFKQGLWGANPMSQIAIIKQPKRIRECPTDEQVKALLMHKLFRARDQAKFVLVVGILADTGMRLSEAGTIKRANIDFAAGSIKVMGKGNKERRVPMSRVVLGAVANYIEQHPTTSPYLFASAEGRPLDNCAFERTVRRACNELGIKPITPHQLRHFFATRMLEHGAKLEIVSYMLGHSSVGITADIYRHITDDEMQREHSKFAPVTSQPQLTEGGE